MFFTEENWQFLGGLNCSLVIILRESIFLVSTGLPFDFPFFDLPLLSFLSFALALRLSPLSCLGLWAMGRGQMVGMRDYSRSIFALLALSLWMMLILAFWGGCSEEFSVLLRLLWEGAISMESIDGTSKKKFSCSPLGFCFSSSFNFLLSFFSSYQGLSGSFCYDSSRLMLISFQTRQFLYFWLSCCRCCERDCMDEGGLLGYWYSMPAMFNIANLLEYSRQNYCPDPRTIFRKSISKQTSGNCSQGEESE